MNNSNFTFFPYKVNFDRKPWLDLLRAFAIILVVYGHCSRWDISFFIFTSPVKMPLFFAITGYLLSTKDNLKTFIEKSFKRLIIPWLILGLLPLVPIIPFRGLLYYFEYFVRMMKGEVLWFMPCFILGQLIWYILRKTINNYYLLFFISFIISIIGVYLVNKELRYISVAYIQSLSVQFFFFLGYTFKKFEQRLINLARVCYYIMPLGYILLVVLGIFIWGEASIDVHLGHYFNYPYCILLISLGCIVLFTLYRRIEYAPKWLIFIGQNTLIIYLLHEYFLISFSSIMGLIDLPLPTNYFGSFLQVSVSIYMCCLIATIINRFIPFIIGK